MATTTNYGWVTPDDTDLVKDGAAAIRTLGSSADTTTKNLNPETTLGDLSFRSSTSNVNTRIGIGTAGQNLTVVAGVPAWATPSDQTPLTTKGDLFTFSTSDDRLGVGANGTTLVADSSEATGLKWATPALANLDIDTITSGNLSGNSTISFTGLTQNYLQLRIFQAGASGAGTNALTVNVNTNTSAIYTINLASNNGFGTDFLVSNTATKWQLNSAAMLSNSSVNSFIVTIFNCAASGFHNVLINGVHRQSDNANNVFVIGQGFVETTTPITSIEFATTGNSFNAGTYKLIGG